MLSGIFLLLFFSCNINNMESLGDSNFVLGNYELSAEEYHQAIRSDPRDVILYLKLAEAFREMNAPEKALSVLGIASKLTEEREAVNRMRAHLYYDLSDLDSALKYIRLAEKSHARSRTLDGLMLEAEIAMKRKQWERAFFFWEQVIRRHRSNSKAYFARAAVRLKLADRQGARKDWLTARTLGYYSEKYDSLFTQIR